MGTVSEVKLIISADGSVAIAGIEKVTGAVRKMESDTSSLMGKMKEHWLGFSAAVYAAYEVVSKGFESMELASKAQQAEASFKAITTSMGYDTEKLLGSLEELSAGTVDASELMQKAVQGMALGLKDSQLVGLMDAARTSARVWGQDVASTYDTLVTAVGGGVRAMGPLVKMGLVTKEQYQELNKVIEAGATDLDMYSLVMANATKQQAEFGLAITDNAERIQKVHASFTELKETIGGVLLATIGRVIAGIEMIGATIGHATGRMKEFFTVKGLMGKADYSGVDADYAAEIDAIQKKWGLIADAPKKAVESVAEADAKIKEIMAKAAAAIEAKALAADIEKTAEATRKLEDVTQSWHNEVENMNPVLDKEGQSVHALWDKYEKLIESIQQTKYVTEEAKVAAIEKAQEDLKQAIIYQDLKTATDEAAAAFKNLTDETIASAETQKKQYEDLIKYAQDYRAELVKTYEDASAEALKYYAIAEHGAAISMSQWAYLEGMNAPKLTREEQLRRDKETFLEASSSAFRSGDIDKINAAFKQGEAYIEKAKGVKDIFGFDMDITIVTEEMRDLALQTDRLTSDAQTVGDAWQEAANRQIAAIQSVDQWIVYLQDQVKYTDSLITQVKEYKVDTSMALSKIDEMIAKVRTLNAMLTGGGNGATAPGTEPPYTVTMPSAPSVFDNSGVTSNASSSSNVHYYSPDVPLGGYASGTNYVPKTGLYQLHRGEAVIPASQNNSRTKNNISFSPTIVVPGGDAKKVDSELARMFKDGTSQLQRQMQRK